MSTGALLDIRGLSVGFGAFRAVDGVDLRLAPGERLGIVGESGSGKSVTMLALMGLIDAPGVVTADKLEFLGRDLLKISPRERRTLIGREMAMVFQDALTALNPSYTVGAQIAEVLREHLGLRGAAAHKRVLELLELVEIPDAKRRADAYPHQLSGGMNQRVMIAMAIACNPKLLIADEPTTALDVTIQAQVLEVMERIQERTSSAIILITHDMGVVAGVADRVIVMYAGRAVEVGSVDQIFYEPHHPYTLGLLGSLPRLDEERRDVRLHRIKGQPPSLVRVPPGCAFHPRCEFARCPDPCSTEIPQLRAVAELDHVAACHFSEEVVKVRPDDLKTEAPG